MLIAHSFKRESYQIEFMNTGHYPCILLNRKYKVVKFICSNKNNQTITLIVDAKNIRIFRHDGYINDNVLYNTGNLIGCDAAFSDFIKDNISCISYSLLYKEKSESDNIKLVAIVNRIFASISESRDMIRLKFN